MPAPDLGASLDAAIRAIIRDVVRQELHAQAAQPHYLTVAEFARRWSLTAGTIRRAIREGRLEAVRIDSAIRIPADAVIVSRRGSENDRILRATENARRRLGLPELSIEERARLRFGARLSPEELARLRFG